MSNQAPETDDTIVTWARRHMRRPGTSVRLNDFIAKAWHIQSPNPGATGTYCGVNVRRFAGDVLVAPLSPPPSGDVCRKCLKQHQLGRALPQGGGASWRKG